MTLLSLCSSNLDDSMLPDEHQGRLLIQMRNPVE